jgi:peroxiredoxin
VRLSKRVCAQLGLVAAFFVLSISVATLWLVPRYSKPVAVADIGTVAPSFELSANNGQKFNLADSRGQVVVLCFSAISDPLITQYYDRMEQLARQYADDGRVKILGINVAYADHLSLAEVRPGAAMHSFPTLVDEHASVASRYSATATPLTVIIDARGVVRYRGPLDITGANDPSTASNSFVEEAIRNLAANATLASAK